jgi:hypothetical protein
MLNSTTLEVAIGMALIYLVLSLLCTAINEAIAGILSSRAKNLERGIRSLFTDGLKSQAKDDGKGGIAPAVTLAEAIYDHGLIQSLYRNTPSEKTAIWGKRFGTNLPSYIPSRIFAAALLDVIFPATGTGGMPADLSSMMASVETLPESKGKEAIVTLLKQAGGDISKTRQAIENWYNDGMERSAGWYKRRTQLILFFIGLIIAVGLNVDSIAISRTLWVSPALRSYAVTTAEQYAQQNSKTLPSANAARDLATLNSLALPIGWTPSNNPWAREQAVSLNHLQSILSLLFVIAGWLLTAIAMTLGAPFWFDTLNHFMVVRSTIKPQATS